MKIDSALKHIYSTLATSSEINSSGQSPLSPTSLLDIFIENGSESNKAGSLEQLLSATLLNGGMGGLLKEHLEEMGISSEVASMAGAALDLAMQNYAGAASLGIKALQSGEEDNSDMGLTNLLKGLGFAHGALSGESSILETLSGAQSPQADLARTLLGLCEESPEISPALLVTLEHTMDLIAGIRLADQHHTQLRA